MVEKKGIFFWFLAPPHRREWGGGKRMMEF